MTDEPMALQFNKNYNKNGNINNNTTDHTIKNDKDTLKRSRIDTIKNNNNTTQNKDNPSNNKNKKQRKDDSLNFNYKDINDIRIKEEYIDTVNYAP